MFLCHTRRHARILSKKFDFCKRKEIQEKKNFEETKFKLNGGEIIAIRDKNWTEQNSLLKRIDCGVRHESGMRGNEFSLWRATCINL